MIKQIKKILYATDLSENSAYAFRYAIDLAQRHDAKIVIFHAIEPVPPYVRHYVMPFEDESEWEEKMKKEQDQTAKRIRERLENFCKRESQTGIPCIDLVSKIIVKTGYPVEEIIRTAEDEECDVIVLGTHGKGFLMETFLGSVARSVLDRTRKPVFIIPLPEKETGISVEGI